MSHFEHTLERLQAIEWWNLANGACVDPSAMITEHFRRMALWCKELNIEDNYWHFTNLAQQFHPDLTMPDNDLLNEEGRIEIPSVPGTTRMMMHHVLDWAYLMDVYPEIPQLYEQLPHPYEPAIKVFESHLAVGYHDYGIEYRLETITEGGSMFIVNIFQLYRLDHYLNLEPYSE